VSVVSGSVFAGVIAGWVTGFVGLSLFFARAWAQRREEGEYLIFSLQTASLAVYAFGLAWMQASLTAPDWRERWQLPADIGTAGAIFAMAFGIHFAARFARLKQERAVVLPIYALSVIYLGAVALGAWWKAPPIERFELPTPVGPLLYAPPSPTLVAQSFYALVMFGILALDAVLLQAYRDGKREVLSSLVGSTLLSVTVLNDASVGAGLWGGPYLTPFGYLLFGFGVSLTLVSRYGSLSRELERRGNELRTRTSELRASYEALQKAQEQLVRKEQLAVVGELAAVIAHEVRNPLAIIGNAVAGLRKRQISPEDHATLLKIIDEEAQRLNRLVSDLLCYARPVSPQRQLISLRETLERTVSRRQVGDEARIEIDVQCDAQTPPVWGDSSLLRQVFDNLIGNAIQAMHGDGTLTIKLQPAQHDGARGVMVEIRDTGEGMDTQIRSRARTPFFTTRPSGTGLGLAIVDRIVEAHGGTMSLDSNSGEGTTVAVFLPQGRESTPPASGPEGPGADALGGEFR
jgi:signal transduction histidine kinase